MAQLELVYSLGSAQVIQSAGPSIILGYAIGGLIGLLIMRQLGEVIVHEPVAGSFSHFAYINMQVSSPAF